MKRVVLIDSGCVAFQLAAIADRQDNPWDALVRLIDCYDSNGGLIDRTGESIAVIWCFDAKAEYGFGKGYWRHNLLRINGIEYKPGRPDNPGISKIKEIIKGRIPECRQASMLSFEADDILANLSQQFSQYPVDILTVDTDLMQLIDDRVRWINTAPYEPIIRGIPEAVTYSKKKWTWDLTNPREIVDIKVTQGDRSDGLPPGTDRGYIDLINPLVKCPYVYPYELTFREASGNTTGITYQSPSAPILSYSNNAPILFG